MSFTFKVRQVRADRWLVGAESGHLRGQTMSFDNLGAAISAWLGRALRGGSEPTRIPWCTQNRASRSPLCQPLALVHHRWLGTIASLPALLPLEHCQRRIRLAANACGGSEYYLLRQCYDMSKTGLFVSQSYDQRSSPG
jgi:hypothetical protein